MQTTKTTGAAHLRSPRCHPNRQPLPAGPLLTAVNSYVSRRRLGVKALFGEAGRRALERGRQSGEMTLVAVEEFCDQLGLHPRELYGDAYDRAAFTYVARRTAPARMPMGERARSRGER
jgi:hypothetical protein